MDDVSLAIPSGSFFSILGPSGCGKTTLLRMIAGFEIPDAGDISIRGRSVLGDPPNRRNVKMIFQHLALFPMMNVGENIAYGLRCRGESRAETARKVDDALRRIGLPGVAAKEIHQLSGGQKQRIAIARCMVLEPDVLLLDEPLGALDLKLREHMKIELKMLQHQFDTTFLYITHDQSEALVMSDQVAVMNGGRFEQVGAPQELYNNPRSAFVASFVGDSNRWRGRAVAVADGVARIEVSSGAPILAAVRGEDPVRAGDPVDVFARPEALALRTADAQANPPAGENVVSGTVDSLLFNGANSRMLVRTADGALIEAGASPDEDAVRFAPGDAVEIAWSPARTLCFQAG